MKSPALHLKKNLKNGGNRTYLNGKLHSLDDKPSLFSPTFNNTKAWSYRKVWHIKGVKGRLDDKPAYRSLNISRIPGLTLLRKKEDRWYSNGKLSRNDDKPAVEKELLDKYYTQKTVTYEKHWFKQGVLHRDGDKPAITIVSRRYSNDGMLLFVTTTNEYYVNGERHREGGKPAIVMKRHNQFIKAFYVNGVLSRDYLPTFVVEEGNKVHYGYSNDQGSDEELTNKRVYFLENQVREVEPSFKVSEIEVLPFTQLESIVETITRKKYVLALPSLFIADERRVRIKL